MLVKSCIRSKHDEVDRKFCMEIELIPNQLVLNFVYHIYYAVYVHIYTNNMEVFNALDLRIQRRAYRKAPKVSHSLRKGGIPRNSCLAQWSRRIKTLVSLSKAITRCQSL